MDAIRQVVVGVNHYGAPDVPELRTRMNLIGSVPALAASAASHYDAWERAVSEFAARRLRQPADSLYPLAIGRTTLAAAAPPTTGGWPGPTPTSPCTSTRRCAR